MKITMTADLPPATPEHTEQVEALAGALGELLHGEDPRVVGGALADVLAMYIAGHVVFGNAEATMRVRTAALALHIDIVQSLIPVNAADIEQRMRKEAS